MESLGAEEAASDDEMVSGPFDLSYMGVYTIWMNLLGTAREQSPSQTDFLQVKRPNRVSLILPSSLLQLNGSATLLASIKMLVVRILMASARLSPNIANSAWRFAASLNPPLNWMKT